ncbi:hypothetical protein M2302_002216 [Micromonospora sp. A200]|uniref:hypothetical protein n=1 Tax=Micromonospora sp. A200 TaxID=2940568 RepID=UPI002474200E|nr:hypothetical protein [Micromonospora sp. A200]MDH6462041.1 hypothetical protein [Micromonospora sp. A200]
MKIVKAHTGADAVPVPGRDVILVDPEIGRTTAINAISAILPTHRAMVESWVDPVIPSRRPVIEAITQEIPVVARQYRPVRPIEIQPGRHRVPQSRRRPLSKPVRVALRSASLAVIATIGLTLGAMIGGGPQPASADGVWSKPAFTTVSQTGIGWTCETHPELAECISDEGAPVTVEAWDGPDGMKYTFEYEDPITLEKHRVDLKVFESEEAERRWHTYQTAGRENLVAGKKWVAYGTDAKRIAKYTKILKQRHK